MTALTDFFIPAPLSAIYTLMLATGMSVVYDTIGLFIFKRRDTWLRAMYFFSGLLVTCWLIWILCLIGFVPLILFRVLAAAFALSGMAIILFNKGKFFARDIYDGIFSVLPNNTWDKVFRVLITCTLIAFILIALAPPTDADSLDYHLGIPIEILRKGSLWFGRDNIHFRMSGWGEMINLLGIVNGCAQLSAMLQVIALFWLLAIFTEAVEAKQKINLIVFILGIPILLFFIPGQKNQLLGAIATSVCFYALSQRSKELSGRVFILFCLALLFAVGIKYSFLISAVSLAIMLVLKYEIKQSALKLFQLFLCFIIILSPIYLYKFSYFGDPLSPLLESLKKYPDPAVVAVHQFIRNYKDSDFQFPVNLLLPSSFGFASSFLGIGVFTIIVSLFNYKQHKAEAIAITIFCILTIAGGQRTARFFLEPFLWSLVLFFTVATLKIKEWISKLARVQYLIVLPGFLLLLYTLLPGILSDKGRDRMMYKCALGYAHSKWLDSTLSKNDCILTDVRSRSLLHQMVFPIEYKQYGLLLDKEYPDSLSRMIKKYNVSYFVVHEPSSIIKSQNVHIVAKVAGPVLLPNAVRNPFNTRMLPYVICKVKY